MRRHSPILILISLVLSFGLVTAADAQCELLGCSGTSMCNGGCGAAGIVAIQHLFQGFTGESGFDLTSTSDYSDSCNRPSQPNGCPATRTPPLRWWAFDQYLNANSGCQPLFDPLSGNSYISSSYDLSNGQPPGIWWLEQAQWASPQVAGPYRIDGCINSAVGFGMRRTVAEISLADLNSGEGTPSHDSWYLVAGADENNSGNSIYDFDAITGGSGPAGNVVPISSVPDISGFLNWQTGGPTLCPGNYGTATHHPLNLVDNSYFDVQVQVSDAAPAYYNEAGLNAGAQLIAGLQILYAVAPEPTSSDPLFAGWRPARDPFNPAFNVAGLIVHGGTNDILVSLPVVDCNSFAGCFIAARIVYQDSSINVGAPNPTLSNPVSQPDGPWPLVSLTGQHCGPVTHDAFCLFAENPTRCAVTFDQIEATRTAAGVKVTWVTTLEDDVFGFKLFRAENPTMDNQVEAVPWIDAMRPGFAYETIDSSASDSTAYWYFIQEVTSNGLGARTPVVSVGAPTGGRDRRHSRTTSR